MGGGKKRRQKTECEETYGAPKRKEAENEGK